MRFFYKVSLRFRSLFSRTGVEDELSDELRFHIERQIAEYVAEGMSYQEAVYAALRTVGAARRRHRLGANLGRRALIGLALSCSRFR